MLLAALVLPAGPATRLIDKESDDPNHLAPPGRQIETNLKVIDQRSLRVITRRSEPWSDVTWKANRGLLLQRYRDSRFEKEEGWRRKRLYLNRFSADWMFALDPRERDRWVETLSPAEKYDLVMGTVRGGLSEKISGFLSETLGNSANFPSWWGLCEGSAASTVYYPEPVKRVVLYGEANRVRVPFYAPDIKGLATLLWSRFNKSLNLPESGLQCKTDGKGCFDSNPASFHASVHHFLDLYPGVLVGEMDPTPVVWNFPLVSYDETYFRPDKGSGTTTTNLGSATVAVSDWQDDPRRSKRSPGTAYIAGVKMTVEYAVNQDRAPPPEGSLKRKIIPRVLTYEIELDADLNMLGGEWVSGKHPDLLWTIPPDSVPDTVGDATLPPGDGEDGTIPASWSASARASAARLTPLRRVVELLVKKSAEER
jgi:hypothetical protein